MMNDVSENSKPRLVVILGATASGKTELAVRLAERFDGEIVNADSMQVYSGMDIGTAKPARELRQRVPHHLIDMVPPDSNFTASDFRREADRIIADIQGRGKRVFVVGGTGLYIKALLAGLVDSPGADEAIRSELAQTLLQSGSEELLRQLSVVDPVTAHRLHPNDHVRIVRAIEVYRQSGHPVSRLRDEHGFDENHYPVLKIGIAVEREELFRRIDARVDRMMADGLLGEVENLLSHGYDSALKSLRSIGYRQCCAFFASECGLDEAIRLIKRDTRHYAKRQMTWFNRDNEIKWLEYPASFDTICNHVIEFFLGKGEDDAKNTV